MDDVSIEVCVNGRPRRASVPPRLTLADFLRERCQLTGTHLGCEHGVCGACTVLVDGVAVRSCLMLAVQARGHQVTTVEGLGTPAHPHPVQRAFIAEQAAQCGYCISGMVVAAAALLEQNHAPTDAQIYQALDGNLCRFGSHLRITRAIKRAAGERA